MYVHVYMYLVRIAMYRSHVCEWSSTHGHPSTPETSSYAVQSDCHSPGHALLGREGRKSVRGTVTIIIIYNISWV